MAPPSPRNTPPTDHETITQIAASANVDLIRAGTVGGRSRNASRTVEEPPAVSGTNAQTAASRARVAAAITWYGRVRGDDDAVATAPERRTPPAMPKFVVELLVGAPIRESRRGWSSSSSAAARTGARPAG